MAEAWKNILQSRGAREFSHSLDPQQSFGGSVSNVRMGREAMNGLRRSEKRQRTGKGANRHKVCQEPGARLPLMQQHGRRFYETAGLSVGT